MVGLAQMVRASDCGPEGRRFDPDIPPHAGIVQRLVYQFSKLRMAVRFRLPAPRKEANGCSLFFLVLKTVVILFMLRRIYVFTIDNIMLV